MTSLFDATPEYLGLIHQEVSEADRASFDVVWDALPKPDISETTVAEAQRFQRSWAHIHGYDQKKTKA